VELTEEGLEVLRGEIAARAIPVQQTWWGYDAIRIEDPDGNELLFPIPPILSASGPPAHGADGPWRRSSR